MGGQLLLSYSTLFCATCLDAPDSRSWNNGYTPPPTSGTRTTGAGHVFLSRSATTMGGQLLLSYSTLFCATCLDAPEYVDGLWDYGGRIHRSAWFPASVGITAGEAGVLSRDGWSEDQNGGVARAVPTPERCRGRSSCVSDRARRY
ncbi:hypothetical protein quinque_008699 [Culex quinquefasciatus]